MEVKKQNKLFNRSGFIFWVLIIFILIISNNCISQSTMETDSLKIKLNQKNSSTVLLTIENHFNEDVFLNTCFDYQTGGEFGTPDITFELICESDTIVPIANFYTKKDKNCFQAIKSRSTYLYELDIKKLFRNITFLEKENVKIKAYLKISYLRDNILKKSTFETEYISFSK